MSDKRISTFGQASIGKRRLKALFLFVTGRCNSKCAMCFYANEMDKKNVNLSFEQIQRISQTAGKFKKLWISGGEPTLRDDLPEIIEMFYRSNNVRYVNIPSNGLRGELLHGWIARLRKSCPELDIVVSLSIDGFGDVHDRQRGVKGSFVKVTDTLRKIDEAYSRDPKVIVNVTTVITRLNVDQVEDFMHWIYGRFNITSHVIEAARGETREDGMKVLTEKKLGEIQDAVAPYYCGYAKRFSSPMKGLMRKIARIGYLGSYKNYFDVRTRNIEHPSPWGMDCTAGETTLVIDYDGRFRACEMRSPIGMVQDYDCDIQRILQSDAMKAEIDAIGHGYKANCWCTHGCWILSSMEFSKVKMVMGWFRGSKAMKTFDCPIDVSENTLHLIEEKYGIGK